MRFTYGDLGTLDEEIRNTSLITTAPTTRWCPPPTPITWRASFSTRCCRRNFHLQPLPLRPRLGESHNYNTKGLCGERFVGARHQRQRRGEVPCRRLPADALARTGEGFLLSLPARRVAGGGRGLQRGAYPGNVSVQQRRQARLPRHGRRRPRDPDVVREYYLRDAVEAVLASKEPPVTETRPVGTPTRGP